jgi:hypothetical protein
MSWGGGKKKGKKQRVRTKNVATNISHPLETLTQFGYLKIKPPVTIEDVPATLG